MKNILPFLCFILAFIIGALGFAYYTSLMKTEITEKIVVTPPPKAVENTKKENIKKNNHIKLKQYQPLKDEAKIPDELRWIAELNLSNEPSHGEIGRYLKLIMEKVKTKRRLRADDAEFILLSVLAENNFQMVSNAILDMGYKVGDYLIPLAKVYSTEADKLYILSNLKKEPDLVKVIEYHQWQKDAKPFLIELLEEQPQNIGWSAMRILLSYEDPSLYPKFDQILIKGRYVDSVVGMIKDLPGTDYRSAMIKAWDKTTTLDKGYLSGHMMSMGHRPALDYVIQHLGDNDDNSNFSAAIVYSRYVEGPVGVKKAQAWYRANKNRIVFNQETKRFYLP